MRETWISIRHIGKAYFSPGRCPYEVSNLGRVRYSLSLDPSARLLPKGAKPGCAVRPRVDKRSGMVSVRLCWGSRVSVVQVRGLVAEAFLSNKPPKGTSVCFIDGDSSNVAVSNLEYRRAHVRPNEKLTEGHVRLIRKWSTEESLSIRRIRLRLVRGEDADPVRVSNNAIHLVLTGKTWAGVQ